MNVYWLTNTRNGSRSAIHKQKDKTKTVCGRTIPHVWLRGVRYDASVKFGGDCDCVDCKEIE
jgi:hypothetical protein